MTHCTLPLHLQLHRRPTHLEPHSLGPAVGAKAVEELREDEAQGPQHGPAGVGSARWPGTCAEGSPRNTGNQWSDPRHSPPSRNAQGAHGSPGAWLVLLEFLSNACKEGGPPVFKHALHYICKGLHSLGKVRRLLAQTEGVIAVAAHHKPRRQHTSLHQKRQQDGYKCWPTLEDPLW